jgi:hypothetical protein
MSAPGPRVRPAFHSRRSAVLFCTFLLVVLLFPLLVQRICPRWRYPSSGVPKSSGHFSYTDYMSLHEAGDIDVLVIGDSLVAAGVDASALEAVFQAQLGRSVRVVLFGFLHRGEEVYYRALRNLLVYKKPTLIVMDMTLAPNDEPHIWDNRMHKMDEGPDFYAGLTLRQRWKIYTHNVLGVPRAILNELREPIPDQWGSGFRGETPVRTRLDGRPFVAADVRPPHPPSADEIIYSEATRDHWQFTNEPWSPFQKVFFDKTRKLIEDNHLAFAVITVPVYGMHDHPKAEERLLWTRQFATPVSMIGLPPTRLFEGLTDAQIAALYGDPYHLNENGARYFARAMAPAIMRLFEEASRARQAVRR